MKKRRKRSSPEYTVVAYLFLLMFLLMVGYLCWYTAFRSETFINNPYNQKRIDLLAESTVRGEIQSADGRVLARTEVAGDGTERRIYPEGSLFAHTVGYDSHGRMGLEGAANFYLLSSHHDTLDRIRHSFTGEKDPGDTVVTTLDYEIQAAAKEAMGGYRGAVVAMDTKTGAVRAMVSAPSFDPGTVAEEYEALTGREDGVLLNRGTQGLYPPGSTFKIVTTLAALRTGADRGFSFDCTGSFSSGGKEIHCYHGRVHGEEDLLGAFADSCNSAYASLGLSLPASVWEETTAPLFFGEAVPFDLATAKASFSLGKKAEDAEVMETAIGQGKTLCTPLQLLLVASAVENGGLAMKPRLLERVENDAGKLVRSFAAESCRRLMSEEEAGKLEGYMRSVVEQGTGTALQAEAYEAFGKTGTAEYGDGDAAHSWFVGFARRPDGETLAVAVVLEGAGAGSSYAVPAARKVFDRWSLR